MIKIREILIAAIMIFGLYSTIYAEENAESKTITERVVDVDVKNENKDEIKAVTETAVMLEVENENKIENKGEIKAVTGTAIGAEIEKEDKADTVNNTKNKGKTDKKLKYATWYGGKFHGRRTTSGEVYNMYKMTAAHRTLPFGTKVKITNPKNNKSVIVRINDRGPWQYKYEIDLSYAAFQKIRGKNDGETAIYFEVVDKNTRIEEDIKVSEENKKEMKAGNEETVITTGGAVEAEVKTDTLKLPDNEKTK